MTIVLFKKKAQEIIYVLLKQVLLERSLRFNQCSQPRHKTAAINEFRIERWYRFLESLSTENNTIWKTASCIRRARTHLPVVNSLNERFNTKTEKCEIIA